MVNCEPQPRSRLGCLQVQRILPNPRRGRCCDLGCPKSAERNIIARLSMVLVGRCASDADRVLSENAAERSRCSVIVPEQSFEPGSTADTGVAPALGRSAEFSDRTESGEEFVAPAKGVSVERFRDGDHGRPRFLGRIPATPSKICQLTRVEGNRQATCESGAN
jgi:hypothetical protein